MVRKSAGTSQERSAGMNLERSAGRSQDGAVSRSLRSTVLMYLNRIVIPSRFHILLMKIKRNALLATSLYVVQCQYLNVRMLRSQLPL